MKKWNLFFIFTITLCCQTHLFAQPPKSLTLDNCIELALKNNQQRAISQSGEEIAKSRLGQARSAYWPQITTQAFATRIDDEPIFVFPEETESYSIGGVLPQPIVTEVTIPEKTIQLLGQNLFRASANLTLPLYTGGLRSGLMKQARAGVQVAQQNTRRTDQEIIYQVRYLYFGAVLAQKLTHIATETLARLTAYAKKLFVGARGDKRVPLLWLDTMLLKNDLPTSSTFFHSTQYMPKTTQAILPVFFQQADACLVPKTDFETAVQLNPQLGINLQILAESPGFKNSIACLQKEYYNNYAGLITEALKTIGQTEQGKQFFTLFRVNTMQRFDEAHLDNVKNLMQTYQTLNQNKQLKKEK